MTAPAPPSASLQRSGIAAGLIGLAGGLVAAVAFMLAEMTLPIPWAASVIAAVVVTLTNAARMAATRLFTTSHYLGTILLVSAAVTAQGGVRLYPFLFVAGLLFFSAIGTTGNTVPEDDGDSDTQ